MTMFTLIYDFKYYRFFKSGLLLDFIIKKLVIKISFFLFFVFNIAFNEKYIIEFFFLRFSNFINYFTNTLTTFTTEFSYAIFSIFLLTIALFYFVFFLINVAFTCYIQFTSLFIL